MPGNGGVLKGCLKVITQKPNEDVWLQVTVPTWTRWKTQVEVGEPAHEGLAPGTQDIWAPSWAVTTDEDDLRRLRQDYLAYRTKC
jgi:hypothetical protein